MKIAYVHAFKNVVLKPQTMRQLPIHIQLEPTTYCNLNCAACTRLKYLDHFQHLTLERFQQILEVIRPIKISLSGAGEPLMNPDFFEMITCAKAQGCSINTTSNGTLFTPETCARMVKSGLDLIKISIDGATPATYQKSRREDRFEQVLDGIRTLTTIKKQHGARTPYLRFNYVILNDNYREMAETVRLAAELGIDAIYFQPLNLTEIEDRFDELVGDLSYDDLAREIHRALTVRTVAPVNTNLSLLWRNLPAYWQMYQRPPRQTDGRICLLPWFSTYIMLDGNVHPCCSCSAPETILGNLFTTPMIEIWNGSRYQRFRKAIREGKRPYAICRDCIPNTFVDIIRSSRILPGFLR